MTHPNGEFEADQQAKARQYRLLQLDTTITAWERAIVTAQARLDEAHAAKAAFLSGPPAHPFLPA